MKIIDRLPFLDTAQPTLAPFQQEVEVKAFQIIVYMCLTSNECTAPPTYAPRFPVILDTGLTIDMTMGPDQFRDWTATGTGALRTIPGRSGKQPNINGHSVDYWRCTAWLYRNVPGTRDRIQPNVKPCKIELSLGVAVYRDAIAAPRLPTLGLRALAMNRLELVVDGAKRTVSIQQSAPRNPST